MSWLQQLKEHIVPQLRHWVAFMGVRRLTGAALSTVVAVCVGWWLLRSPAPPVETAIARVTTTSSTNTVTSVAISSTVPVQITVHVAGAVNKPGVYVLPTQSRVIDAVNAAGGPIRSADIDAINLASPLVDSEQIIVPRRGEKMTTPPQSSRPSSGSSGSTSPKEIDAKDALININTATATELEVLPGVGPSTAKSIVTHRTTVAPFASIDDLLQVSGIGPTKLEAMRAYVTL